MLREFLRSESGAVAADWVFLTTAITTTGLATMANTSGGVENLADDLAEELASIEIQTAFRSFTQREGFSNGRGDFIGGQIGSSEQLGNVLRGGGSDGEQMAQAVFDLEENMAFAEVSFDVHAIDSWDGEDFQVFVNNEVVATISFDHRDNHLGGTWTTDNPDVQVAVQYNGHSDAGFDSEWPDQSASMSIRVAQPGNQMTVGFGSTLNQELSDESWGVDNVTVVSTNDPGD